MNTTSQIPTTVHDIFQRIPVVDEFRQLFSRPTSPLLDIELDACVDALRPIEGDANGSAPHPAIRFMMEAQLAALEDTLTRISDRHPEQFRDTERGFALIRNLEILLNGALPGDCGPATD